MSARIHRDTLARRIRGGIIALLFALIGLTVAWQLSDDITAGRALLAALATLPLWAPLDGILRRRRRTYAWATLCVIPYFVFGITEAIANPTSRAWAGACLALALPLFVLLIAYLRITPVDHVADERDGQATLRDQ